MGFLFRGIMISIILFHLCVYFKNVRLIITLASLVTLCNAYKVLFLAPVIGKSHFLFMQTIVRALLDRGHEVSYLTSNSLNHLKLANYTEYLVDPPFDFGSLGMNGKSMCSFSFHSCLQLFNVKISSFFPFI